MYAVSPRFLDVVIGTHRAISTATLLSDRQIGVDPVGGIDLPMLGGDVKMTAAQDVKATLELTVPGGYWAQVQPYGAEVFVRRGVDFGDGTRELVPLGYYRIDSAEQGEAPYGPVRLTGSDRIAAMQQNRVLYPYQVPDGTSHRTIFERLVNGRATPTSAINTAGYAMLAASAVPITWSGYDPDRATVDGGQSVDDSTYDFLAKLADDKACVLRFDEAGTLVVDLRRRDPATPAVYVIEPGRTGNLIKASRQTSREGVYNIVSAYGSDPVSPTGYQLSFNNDPASPIRWDGPFGPAPRYYASPLLRTADAAAAAAATVLSRYTGLPETDGLWVVPNPALRPLDMISAQLTGLPDEHLIDEVTIPLGGSDPVMITTKTATSDVEPDLPTPPPPGGTGAPTQAQRDQEKCFELTSTAENSALAWWTQYRYLQDIGDGRGYTGGIVGVTSATGDMLELVRDFYVAAQPAAALGSYISGLQACETVGQGGGASAAAASNLGAPYTAAWQTAADTDAIFRQAQRNHREQKLWAPVLAAAQADGVGTLGLALYYDTMVNHGPGVANSGDGSFDDIRSAAPGSTTTQLGKTTDGTGSSVSSTDKTAVSTFTAAAAGTLSAGHVRTWLSAAGSTTVKCVVYADSAGAPGALLAQSDPVTLTATAAAVVNFTFSGANRITIANATTYWIGLSWQDPGTPSVTLSRDSTAGGRQEVSSYLPNPFGTPSAQSGPMDAWVDVATAGTAAPPSGGGNETTWLTNWLTARSTVLTAWGDNPPDGRIKMFTDLLGSGNLALATPFSWSVYGDAYSMPRDPDPYVEGTGGGTGETGTPTATTPGQLHNIGSAPGQNHFNLGVGFRSDSPYGKTHKDFSQSEIAAGLSIPGYYELSADGSYVTATSYPDGGRTSANTKYSRVEYREFEQNGTTKMAFNPSRGRHYIQGRSASVAPLSAAKPELVWAQMHDSEDDTAMIYQRDETTIQAKVGDSVVATLSSAYVMSTPTDWMIELVDGTINFYFGDLNTPAHSQASFTNTSAGQYFKAFDYMQWNTDNGGSNPPPAVMRMYRLEHWHSESTLSSSSWPKPTIPGAGTGGGGGTGGGSTGGTGGPAPDTDGEQAAVKLGWGPVIDGDEFDYVGPPRSNKWGMYDGPGHDGNGIRSPGAFSVADGTLTCYGDAGGTTGGMAFNRDQTYFRIEWRVRAYSIDPSGSGNRYHPVLILWPTSEQWPQGGEFDFYEVDCDTGKYEAYLHIPGNDGSAQRYVSTPLDLQNWHNIAFEWSRSGIRGWIDGAQAFDFPGFKQPPGPMHPTFQLDNFFGSNMESAKFEARWVRIYASPGSSGKTQAAQLILDRFRSGKPISEDWTWTGAPPVVGQYNDALLSEWAGDGSPDEVTWLQGYVDSHG